MKKVWVLVLLISLGLNLGLAMRLLRADDRLPAEAPRSLGQEEGRGIGRWAGRDSTARGRMFDRRLEHLAGILDLRPVQRETFIRVQRETGRLLMAQRVAIGQKREALFDLISAPDIDREQVQRALAELGEGQAVLDSLVAETMIQEMEVLDPGQRARYLQMMARDRNHLGGGPGDGPRRRHRQ